MFDRTALRISMEKNRGSIALFASYRPPVPLDIFSCPLKPNSSKDEVHMTDGRLYNYNGQVIEKRPIFALFKVKGAGVKSAIVFISEQNNHSTHNFMQYKLI